MIDPRWRVTLAVTPYVVLGMLVAFVLVAHWGAWTALVPTLALCAAYGALVLVMRTLRSPWRDRPAAVAIFMAAAIALNLALVLREGVFGFLVIATFSFAYSLVAWPWELLAVACTAVVAGLAQSSSLGRDLTGIAETLGIIGLNVVVMCGTSFGLHLAEQTVQRKATEDERARLAREIHDTLAQGFTGVITQLQAADQANDTAARDRHTRAALALAREGLAEARRSVNALRPPALDETTLPDALAEVARAWTRRTGIPATVTTSGAAGSLPTRTQVALLRTTQEALANVEQHAAAGRVAVTLRADAAHVRLEVCDDGRGFDVVDRLDTAGGYGLVAMRERLAQAAGGLVVESRPGHGTIVRADVPA